MDIRIRLTREDNLKYFKVSSDTIVTMSVEEYLLGVVPAEVGNAPVEVCKAQAVAARTFATLFAKKGQAITDQASIHQAYRAALGGCGLCECICRGDRYLRSGAFTRWKTD